jgi:hypothetical protein
VGWCECTLTSAKELESLSSWVRQNSPKDGSEVLAEAIACHPEAARRAANTAKLAQETACATGDPLIPGCLEIEVRCQPAEAAVPDRKTDDPGRQHARPGSDDVSHPPTSPPESRPPATSVPGMNLQGISSARVQVVKPKHLDALGGLRSSPCAKNTNTADGACPD